MNTANLIEQYERDGCIRIEGLLNPDLLQRVRRELERYSREIAPQLPPADRTFETDGKTVRNLWRMEQHDPFFAELPRRPEILDLVRELVHGEPVLAAVETFNKPPRIGSGVPPHQDNAYFCQSPPDMLTVWISIDAATPENGPIYYLKSSHRDGVHPHHPSGVAGNSMGLVKMPPHEDSDVFIGTLGAGDALIHHCQTIHWSAPNKTDHPRRGLLLVFRADHTRHDEKLKADYDRARAPAPAA